MEDIPRQLRAMVQGEVGRRYQEKHGKDMESEAGYYQHGYKIAFDMCCEAIWALAISNESLSMLLGDATPPAGMLAPSLAPILPELVKLAKERKGE